MSWKPIENFEGIYEVSSNGAVKVLSRVINMPSYGRKRIGKEKILKPGSDTYGYLQVKLQANGKDKTKKVHRLVSEAFIPNPQNKKGVNHKDGNKKNNYVDNLEWATPLENNRHAYNKGLNPSMGIKLTPKDIRDIRSKFAKGVMQKELAREYSKSKNAIHCIIKKKTWKDI